MHNDDLYLHFSMGAVLRAVKRVTAILRRIGRMAFSGLRAEIFRPEFHQV
jgi:hypothetical protein